ncbi:MAG: ATP-binding protein [Anaerolineae bacterium]|nr:ATP-binding protein [Anaerolineae bacterium]MDW8173649.1 ATP-binding protein [Anaerolineae bacterium]
MLVPSNAHEPFHSSSDAERFVQAVLDALSAHIALLDESGTIIAVNQAWRDFADCNGLPRSSAYGLGSNYLAICNSASWHSANEAPLVALGLRDVMRGNLSDFELEYPCHSPTEQRWFVARVSRFEWDERVRIIVAHQNITELKRAQQELSRSQRRIEAILNNVNNGIITVDTQGIIRTANRAAARIFGYAEDTLPGLPLVRLLGGEFRGAEIFRHLNGELGHELRGLRADGSVIPIYFSLSELCLDDGGIYTCIIQDITYRKQMEEQAIEQERMRLALEKERDMRALKNRLLSMMSHELRTPLASISLSYDMLKKYGSVSTPEEREQALDNIQIQLNLLKEMIGDVMTLSRGDSDGFQIAAEDCDLITYCRDVLEEFQFHHHHTHRIEFECNFPALRAEIDRKLLRRALTNLINNAIKYSPRGGLVLLRLSCEGEQAIIEIRDEGIGIPPEDQSRLFEPFYRARNTENIPGTGLGLAIARQMVELHSGTLSFASRVGVGTSFTIRLPLRQPLPRLFYG